MKMRYACVVTLLITAGCASTTPQTGEPPARSSDPTPLERAASTKRLTPVASTDKRVATPTIRVGLLSDQSSVSFPRRDDGYVIVAPSGAFRMGRGFTLAAPLPEASVRYAVQVATISDNSSAEAFAQKIRTETGQRADLVFDAANGTNRIVAGDFASSAEAEPLRSRLTQGGYGKDMLVVRRRSETAFEKQIELVDDEGDRHTFRGESITIFPGEKEGILLGGQPYRGAGRIFVNARGLLNIINDLGVEQYLRGVVPNELGPRVYDELEAQKAQALAARTYAVKRLGEYTPEGFDICPTPACQVYKGMATEEPMSNQAIEATAGQIITHGGQAIDSLFSATCGGQTSDVGVMFPGRNEPYLKSVSCVELRTIPLAGRRNGPLVDEVGGDALIYESLAGITSARSALTAAEAGALARRASTILGLTLPEGSQPASTSRADVLRYLADVWKLDTASQTLLLPEDRRYFYPTRDPQAKEILAAAFLLKYRVLPAQMIDRVDLTRPMPREELLAMLYSWLEKNAAISEVTGRITRVDGRNVTLKVDGKASTYALSTSLPLFRRFVDRMQELDRVDVMIGDRATMVLNRQGAPVAAVIQANYDGATFDRYSSYSSWVRSWRENELVEYISRRNPIQSLADIRPLGVDEAERVEQLELTVDGGRKLVLAGLPIRWSLNIPDNVFVYTKSQDADGVARWTFFGKGWGHGVGLCQVGAFGMAMHGRTAEEIVKHYYTGVAIEPMR
jgi:stage II sporulation protein D